MKTIYNTYVKMESQEQCDRMAQLVIDKGLPTAKHVSPFDLTVKKAIVFSFSIPFQQFFSYFKTGLKENYVAKKEITEDEFIELLNKK
jgi:hypothetical protein